MNWNWLSAVAVMFLGALAMAQTTEPSRGPSNPKVNPDLPTFWLIGDSTVRNGRDTGDNGQWGWGNPIASYFDTKKLNIANRAVGGTSSRTFYRDLWPDVRDQIKPGDFLSMQFGANDSGAINEPPGPRARARASIKGNGEEVQEIENQLTNKHEVVHTYGWYLRTMINEAKEKGAKEVYVCSPVVRSDWKEGKLSASSYNAVAEAAAKQVGANYIALNEGAIARFESIGEEKTKAEYYPDNEKVHPAWLGSIVHAEVVIEGIKKNEKSELLKYLLPTPPKDLKNPTGKPR